MSILHTHQKYKSLSTPPLLPTKTKNKNISRIFHSKINKKKHINKTINPKSSKTHNIKIIPYNINNLHSNLQTNLLKPKTTPSTTPPIFFIKKLLITQKIKTSHPKTPTSKNKNPNLPIPKN